MSVKGQHGFFNNSVIFRGCKYYYLWISMSLVAPCAALDQLRNTIKYRKILHQSTKSIFNFTKSINICVSRHRQAAQNHGWNAKSNFISLPSYWEDPGATPGGAETLKWEQRHRQAQPILMASGTPVCAHLSRTHAHLFYHPAPFYFFVISELWSSLSQDRQLKHVHEGASKTLQTRVLSLHKNSTSQNRQGTNSSRHKVWHFRHYYFPGFVILTCKVTRDNLQSSSPFFYFQPTPPNNI